MLFIVHVEADWHVFFLKVHQCNPNCVCIVTSVGVLHFQEHTRVGSANSQDIQLCGMAIQAEHCVIDITENNGVVLTPHRNARYVVNPRK